MSIVESIDELLMLTENGVMGQIIRKVLDPNQRKAVTKLYLARSKDKGDPTQRAMTLARQLEQGNWLSVPFKKAKEILSSVFK